jgi:hypothetical protein
VRIVDKLNLRIVANSEIMEMEVESTLLQGIQKGQLEDGKIQEIKCNIYEEESPGFKEDDQGVLWYKGRIYVPNIKKLKDNILREAHNSGYSIHPGGNKMYQDLKATYWYYGMKRDIAQYVANCDTCQSQDRASTTHWIVAALAYTRVEGGRDCYGFHRGITQGSTWI